MVADAIAHVMSKSGCQVRAYIDDFLVIAPRDKAEKYFNMLSDLFDTLGLPMNPDKRIPPCKSLVCLGIQVNLTNYTLKIAPDKLHSIYNMCLQVHNKKFLSRRSFQSLLGKLLYIHKCVVPARTFVNRILMTFRANSHKNRIKLDQEFHQDILWFIKFLPTFNGITFFNKKPIENQETLHLDASLTGLGAIWNRRVYATPIYQIPGFDLKIVHLEMWNIVLALKMWGHFWVHSNLTIYCDNYAVVQVMNSHRTKDPFLAICDRNVWLLTAKYDISLQVSHIRGVKNTQADVLSRLYSHLQGDAVILEDLRENYTWDHVPHHMFQLDFHL